MTLVVILTIRPGALESFRAFEGRAARILERHGSAIERVVAIPPQAPGEPPKEVHLVRFPTSAAFAAYRADPEWAALAPLREASILATEILAGEDAPLY
jgi:hypothetical protein